MWQEFWFWSCFWFCWFDVSCFSNTSFEFGDEGNRDGPFWAASASVLPLLQSLRIRFLISVGIGFMADSFRSIAEPRTKGKS